MQRGCIARYWAIVMLVLMGQQLYGQSGFTLVLHPASKDTLPVFEDRMDGKRFRDREACASYLSDQIGRLRSEGYLEANLDSIHFSGTSAHVWLHAGRRYVWSSFSLPHSEQQWLDAGDWDYRPVSGSVVDLKSLESSSEKWLAWMENNGYPFAAVAFDSVRVSPGLLSGQIKIEKGPLYRIDSLVVTGDVALSMGFLEKYLEIERGSAYRKDRLERISTRLSELGYVRETSPWQINLLGTGAVLNLFLESKKVNQVNVLVGLMPDNVQRGGRMLLTGDAQGDLRNIFGRGERIAASWQQIQYRSPRLKLFFQQPYLFQRRLGIEWQFDFLRKDTSYLNIQTGLGLQFLQSAKQAGLVSYQYFTTRLLDVDTARLREMRRLPDFTDVASHLASVEYRYTGANDRYNPSKGIDLTVSLAAGFRMVRVNPAIASMDKNSGTGQFRFAQLYDSLSGRRAVVRSRIQASKYLPAGRQSVFRLALQGGALLSRDVFRNELFQIGGLRLMRGFDEESIFASSYAVGTLEYRLLTGARSFLYAFSDAGIIACTAYQSDTRSFNLGVGAGIQFETRAGMLNLAYAMGKREGEGFYPGQSKIHLGLSGIF